MFAIGKELYRGLGHHPSAIWNELDNESLTSKLYTKLLYKTFENLPRINADYISFSLPCSGLEYLGKITSTIGRRVFYDLIEPSSFSAVGEGSVDYVDIFMTDRRKINGQKPKIKICNISIKEPRYISLFDDDGCHIDTDIPDVNFSRYDFELEKYLKKADIGQIESVEDLKHLARNVSLVRNYEDNEEKSKFASSTALGKFMDTMAVCVEFSGLMYALLTLKDIDTDLLFSENHAFIGAAFQGKEYIIDSTPPFTFVIPKENYLEELEKLGQNLTDYKDYKKLNLVQNIIL